MSSRGRPESTEAPEAERSKVRLETFAVIVRERGSSRQP